MSIVLNLALVIVFTLLDMFMLMIYFKACLGKRRAGISKLVFILVYVIAFTLDVALSQFGYAPFFYVIKSLLLFFILSIMYDAKWVMRILFVLIYQLFSMISEVISYSIAEAVLNDGKYIADISVYIRGILNFIITTAVFLIMRSRTVKLKAADYIRLMITPVVSFFILILISIDFGNGGINSGTEISLASGGLIIINLIVFFLIENLMEVSEIREKESIMERQFEFQEKKYEQASRSFKSISSVVHDTNKHLVYLRECLDRQEYDEAKRYISTATEHIDKTYKRVNTGFLPIDALVSNSLNISEDNGIKFKYDIKIEKERITIERYDLCVALGNLLDNAVDAGKAVSNPDDRYISVSIATSENSLIINIENSAERAVGAVLKTNKENKLLHGYGISNVQAIAEKYGGVFTIERRESSCEATFIAPIG